MLIHELGHALTAKRLGIASEDILIWPLGGLAFIAHSQSAKSALRGSWEGRRRGIAPALLHSTGLPREESPAWNLFLKWQQP